LSYRVEFSRAARNRFLRLDRSHKERVGARVDELASNPYDPRISGLLANKGGLRMSRVGGRIIFSVKDQSRTVYILALERRGQVCQRL
jgi:mRNA-degrading endonuclease RelE of RelBE toxin-antitoxin system